ncbi:hypothetical protein EON76_05290 [bacterium]|nr:MAG: hypothetical protein EON76_05290 [bacterium]
MMNDRDAADGLSRSNPAPLLTFVVDVHPAKGSAQSAIVKIAYLCIRLTPFLDQFHTLLQCGGAFLLSGFFFSIWNPRSERHEHNESGGDDASHYRAYAKLSCV